MKFEEGPPPDAAVAQGLAAMKRDGGTVLVVGAARAAHTELCEQFDSADAESVYVCTEGSARTDCCEADSATVIDRQVPTRSATSSTSTGATDIGSVGAELRTTMKSLADGETPVRVCFDSLRPFVDSTDLPTLVSVLESIQTVADETGAVVHFHLPAMSEAIPTPLFGAVDAVVKVLRQGDTTYQQWHLPEQGTTTDWVTI